VIQEYLALHHMKEVRPTHNSASYYLPHHAVLMPESTYNHQAACGFQGLQPFREWGASPVLQSDLTIQILKWRYFR